MTSIAEKRGDSYMHVPQQTRPRTVRILRAKPPVMRAEAANGPHTSASSKGEGRRKGRKKNNSNNARRKYY